MIGRPPPLTDVTYYPGQHAGHYFLGEYLLWQTHLPSTAFAADMLGAPPGGLAAPREAHTDFGQHSGFRAGLGYRTYRGWDAGFIFTSFDNHGYAAVGDRTVDTNAVGIVDANLALLAFNGNSILFPGAGLADEASQWLNLKYRTYDLELGKTFIADETMALRIFGGVRGANLDINSNTTYANAPAAGGPADLYTSAASSAMQGIGLRAGGEGSKRIHSSGFVLFARGAVLDAGLAVRRHAPRHRIQRRRRRGEFAKLPEPIKSGCAGV